MLRAFGAGYWHPVRARAHVRHALSVIHVVTDGTRRADPILMVRASRTYAKLANFKRFCKILQILAGSFSAVSKRIFARKYAFDSIFQALQDLHPFAPLRSQKF